MGASIEEKALALQKLWEASVNAQAFLFYNLEPPQFDPRQRRSSLPGGR